MAEKKKTDRDYLFISAMLKAREARALTREKMDRMLSAETVAEAAKLLTESGYEDMSGLDAGGVDAALARHRKAVFDEVLHYAPQKELVDVFRLKYDYHNVKVLVKADGAGVPGGRILSGSGRAEVRALEEAYRQEDYRYLPPMLAGAMEDARSTLARTGNPQLADFVVDRAYFAELQAVAKSLDSRFLAAYIRLLIDNANLRAAVRTVRMGRDREFMLTALVRGGDVSPERLAQSVLGGDGTAGAFAGMSAGGDGMAAIFAATPLREAALLGAEAMKGGSMTRFELACDNALTAFLGSVKLVSFGQEPVAEYLAMTEAEITAIRMILTGRLAGIAPDVIRERLREIHA